MRIRTLSTALAALPLLTAAADAPAPAASAAVAPLTLTLVLTGLRSSDGEVRVCIWHQGGSFPDCRKGQDVRRLQAPAAQEVRIAVEGLAPGSYAVSAIHDENGNRKLDKSFVGIPTEGVGFSHNPRVTFGPPPFAKARFDAVAQPTQTIRMKYFL